VSKAIDWLRSHGSARASSKVAGRETTEGLVGICLSPDNSTNATASLVKIAAETDFASRNQSFGSVVESIAKTILRSGESDVEKVPSMTTEENKTVKETLDELILAIRENLSLKECTLLETKKEGSAFVGYVHGKAPGATRAGTSAAVVELWSSRSDKEDLDKVGKALAMHVVAAKPEYLSIEDVPKEIVEKEKSILMEQVADSGKPANILEKMINGKMRKFYQEICLLEQSHMLEEGNPVVSKFLKGKGIEILSFKSISVK